MSAITSLNGKMVTFTVYSAFLPALGPQSALHQGSTHPFTRPSLPSELLSPQLTCLRSKSHTLAPSTQREAQTYMQKYLIKLLYHSDGAGVLEVCKRTFMKLGPKAEILQNGIDTTP